MEEGSNRMSEAFGKAWLTGRPQGAHGQNDFYAWRAERLQEKLRVLGLRRLLDGEARSVELGHGR